MFRVAKSLLLQILKIWLNRQSHKPLNERKQREKFFLCSPKKAQRQMAQIRRSLDGWILNNVLLPWQRILCSELCDDFVLPGESTTARRGKMPKNGHIFDNTGYSTSFYQAQKRTIRSFLAYLVLSLLNYKSHRKKVQNSVISISVFSLSFYNEGRTKKCVSVCL